MVINSMNNILDFANSDFVNALANIAQIYDLYQSAKAGTYAQLNHDIALQTSAIEHDLDIKTQDVLDKISLEIKKTYKQNEELISQNKQIIDLLKNISNK